MQPKVEHLERRLERSLRVFGRDQAQWDFLWHHHREAELTFIVEGRGRRYIGDSVGDYQAGELVLLGPWLPHTWASSGPGPHRAICVQFDADWLSTIVAHTPEFAKVRGAMEHAKDGLMLAPPAPKRARRGRAVAKDAAAIDSKSHVRRSAPTSAMGGEGASVLAARIEARAHARADALADPHGLFRALLEADGAEQVALFLAILVRIGDAPPASSRRLSSPKFSAATSQGGVADERVRRVHELIERALPDAVTQVQAAKVAGMTPAAFSRFFRRATGHTFVDHLHERRVGQACHLLLESARPITDVCFAAGFGNVSNFNRIFRRLKGLSPRAYRAAYREGSPRV